MALVQRARQGQLAALAVPIAGYLLRSVGNGISQGISTALAPSRQQYPSSALTAAPRAPSISGGSSSVYNSISLGGSMPYYRRYGA